MRTVATPGFRRRRTAPVWHALNRFVYLLIFLVGGAVMFFFFQPELNRLAEMRRQYQDLEGEKERTTIEQLRLSREVDLLQNDPTYLENIARDKLDLMKPGETIYRLDQRTATPM
jgi:cell division protein FtsB